MREELIRVLNYKLNDINSDIEALNDLNNKIDTENEKLAFVANTIDLFKDNDNGIMNFAKITKDDFNKLLSMLSEDVTKLFETESCNYDGLVYLINGINNGVSLSLTDEQKNAVEHFISSLKEKRKEYSSAVEGYKLVKTRYNVSDVDLLNEKRQAYEKIIKNLDNNEYIVDIDLLVDAVEFSELSGEEEVELLAYVLQYNADVYNGLSINKFDNETKHEEEVDEKPEITLDSEPEEETNDISFENEFNNEEAPKEEINFEPENNDFEFHTTNSDNLFDMPTFDIPKEEEEKEETDVDRPIDEFFVNNEEEKNDNEPMEINIPVEEKKEEENEYVPFTGFQEDKLSDTNPFTFPFADDLPKEEKDETVEIPEISEPVEEEKETIEEPVEEPEEEKQEEVEETTEEKSEEPIDSDFKDVIDSHEDYEEYNVSNEESMTSTRELQKLFDKYGVNEDTTFINELVVGDINNYQSVLETLEKCDLIKSFEKNKELMIETLLNSKSDAIEKILEIIKNDLSVDDEDYAITTKIAIDTIPSIFVVDGGNYNNFVENIKTFKDLEINLINLFDFSKEIFVADHERIVNNLEIVKKYNLDINYKNAKYLLLLANVGDRIDYYVESVYEDKLKEEKFDGIEYVNNYTAKLNVVTDETIKRLRYASENGKKVFGSKPKSLSGEITNLKVNALDITPEYMDKFFNNDFANLTGEEVREYVKLIHNSSNVGNYGDELEVLDKYRDGLRYNIEGILVSYNKVQRNYSILRSYGIDPKKALEFAVCYNLIIMKEEYDKLNNLLEEIGGNL